MVTDQMGGQNPSGSSTAPRVAHIISSLGPGGAERQVEQLVKHAPADVAVICLYDRGLVADAIEAGGVPVTLLGMDGASKLTAALRLARKLRALRPEVVNVHLLAGQLWGTLAARLAGVPVIVSTEHSLMDDTIEGRPHRWWLRLIYRVLQRLCDHTVAVSSTTAARLRAWGIEGRTISVIENAVDFDAAAYRPQNRATGRDLLGLPRESLVIGAVGRLEAVKRFDVLIDAATPLLGSRDAYLVIIGEGTMRPALEKQAVGAGVADRTILPGLRPDVTALLSCFDLFVSPSWDETFGIAIVEALANGLPVIYAECPALDDLTLDAPTLDAPTLDVTAPSGYQITKLLPLADQADKANAVGEVGELTKALDLALANVGRQPVSAVLRHHYDAVRVAEAYGALYTDLLAARLSRRQTVRRVTPSAAAVPSS